MGNLNYKKQLTRKRTIWLIVILIFFYCCTYRFYGISGYVYDEQTKQPIEGAVVVMAWQSWGRGYGNPRPEKQIALKEAVTDKNGNYVFRPFIVFDVPIFRYVNKKHEPKRFVVTENVIVGNSYNSPTSKDIYVKNEKVIAEERFNRFMLAQSIVSSSTILRKCANKNIPMAVKLLYAHHSFSEIDLLAPKCHGKGNN